jgi:hypothetical protein
MYANLERWVIFAMAALFLANSNTIVSRSAHIHYSAISEETSYLQPSIAAPYNTWDIVLRNSSVYECLTSERSTPDTSVNFLCDAAQWFSALFVAVSNGCLLSEGVHSQRVAPTVARFRLYCSLRL